MRPVTVVKAVGVLMLVAAAIPGSVTAGSQSPAAPEASIEGVAWRVDVAAHGYAVEGGTVVATGSHGATGIDVRSGATRWRYEAPSGSAIASWAVTGGAVTLAMDDAPEDITAGSYTRWQVVGLDATTGQRLWGPMRQREELLPPIDYVLHGSSPEQIVAGGGMVIVPGYPGVKGVDARTGGLAWAQPLDDVAGGLCDVLGGGDFPGTIRPLVAASGGIVAVAAGCRDGQVVIGVDLRTGDVRWTTSLPGDAPDRLLVDGAILVGQGTRSTILDVDGRVRHEGVLPPRERVMAVVGDYAVVVGTDGASDPLVAVDLRDGRTPWSASRPSTESALALRRGTYRGLTAVDGAVLGYRLEAGGRVSGRQSMGIPDENLLPAAIDRIDPATGAVRSVAVPVVGATSWITAVNGLLLLASVRGLTALRLGAGDLPSTAAAPAPPDRWPDACALVSAEQLAALRPNTNPTLDKQYAEVLGLAIPTPVQCHYTDPNGEAFLVVVIRWVADDPRGAEVLATAAHRLSAGMNLWEENPEDPMLPAVGVWAFGDATDSVTLRAGTVIAEVRSWDFTTVPAVEVARLVGEKLTAMGYR
ncbi:PQQ-binding-like beta-propeller repeat protein [Umezawaea sp. Da 62-37]|uniref:outer membrane protein assembly factor BamB family protein n=1 Tax=Umezawaea sp. Da 62-37 TaxID=3075927 RepID=UPI0028F6F7D8|nr:PQQ-binding-like beta-propeller repeat protein [Umezawaea sp. Da 62-37]WNV84979.1 PQQ-binding-like beta-propeller repeat protein [Umezawaea sp. Da 62-37]